MDKYTKILKARKDEVLLVFALALVVWFGYDAMSQVFDQEQVADNLSAETSQRIDTILESN
jgi:TRAP-type C4-dicarboxylate transport system permease small subunit